MKTTTEAALAGTALVDPVLPEPYATALAGVSGTPERRLLLCAGLQAAARAAGRKAGAVGAVEPAAPDVRAPCSPRVAALLSAMFDGVHAEALPEALALLDAARLRLPHALLPRALAATQEAQRSALRPLLDARGAWLAKHDPRAAWALAAAAGPGDLERAWSEGKTAERLAALVAARRQDAALARAWLEKSWEQEGAEARVAFLGVLGTGTTAEDEPFLERALGDRSGGVRGVAQDVLARLPSSAFVARMRARGDASLRWSHSALALLGKNGTLDVVPPEGPDAQAVRDGLGKPPAGGGEKAYWIARILSALPPAHWEERFGAKPEAIVGAGAATDWASALAEGWTAAAVAHRDVPWLRALWSFWSRAGAPVADPVTVMRMLTEIARALPTGEASDDIVCSLLEGGKPPGVPYWLEAIPAPWSPRVAGEYLRGLRRAVAAERVDPQWFASLRRAAIALPPGSFAGALEPFDVAAGTPWDRALSPFTEILRVRQALHQEIRP